MHVLLVITGLGVGVPLSWGRVLIEAQSTGGVGVQGPPVEETSCNKVADPRDVVGGGHGPLIQSQEVVVNSTVGVDGLESRRGHLEANPVIYRTLNQASDRDIYITEGVAEDSLVDNVGEPFLLGSGVRVRYGVAESNIFAMEETLLGAVASVDVVSFAS